MGVTRTKFHLFILILISTVTIISVSSFSESSSLLMINIGHVESLEHDWEKVSLLYPGIYHNHSEVLDEIKHFNTSVPQLIDLESIGHSIEGRDIYCVKITNENITRTKAGVLFVAHHHSREQITVEVALRFIQRLVNNYGIDEEITNYIDTLDIYIIPTLNPDGLSVVVDQGYEWLRKNLRSFDDDGDGEFDEDRPDDANGDGHVANYEVFERIGDDWSYLRSYMEGLDDDRDTLFNEDDIGGVDLNRNYDYRFNDSSVDSGWGSDKTSYTYPGSAPFSEPETASLRDFVLQHKFAAAISLHSGVNATYFPWASENARWAESKLYKRINNTLQDMLPSYFIGTRNSVSPSKTLIDLGLSTNAAGSSYSTAGDWADWMYAVAGCNVPMTFEIYHNASADNWDTYKLYSETSDQQIWEWTGMYAYFAPEEQYIESVWMDVIPVMDYWLELTPRLVIDEVSVIIEEVEQNQDLITVDLYINNPSPELTTQEDLFLLEQDGTPISHDDKNVEIKKIEASTEKVVQFIFELPRSLSNNISLLIGNNYTGFFSIDIIEIDKWSSYINFRNTPGFLTNTVLLFIPVILMRIRDRKIRF